MRKNVAILVFDDVEVLDFAGPFEVFAVTDELRSHTVFNVVTVAPAAGTIRARNGLGVVPGFTIGDCPPPDILVVPGGFGTRALLRNEVLIHWIQEKSRAAEITMSVCTGALLLAQAGILEGRRVTTHHDAIDLLRKLAPNAIVDPGARFHDTGGVLTAAGISAGIDCALHLVGRVLGEAAARETAAYMEYERRT
ncbi:MAG: DJ-1/PfpI family protein [Opitutaceae bacterium]|jgi:transcriptional regulator GlxA family with amidase domain